ncbi:MAG: histidine kinase dimerization/phosphoacceptor domain-containing protein, partial [Verrucomicrobia bacterium]|nr:histidine kinase dimerization/phosphoacceptor domain-containing protein [Verrucomicrobiota bacterium]
MLALAGFAVAEQVDPRFPADRPAIPPEEWTRWPRARVRQLEAERDQLLKKTSILPQHNPKALSDHLGYHSLFEEPVSDGSLSPHQIDIEMSWAPYLDSIALIPSFKSTGSGVAAYAFPKRFKIEVLDTKTGDYEIAVNWMDEDFPDPGPYPVFFSEINRPVKRVRITILPMVQESGAAYFALGEIYMFQQEAGGRVGANMATWGSNFIKITSSGSFRQLPLWDTQYLNDDVQGLGFPLSDETVSVPDFLIKYEDGMPFSGQVKFILDLGEPLIVGRIDFWPAAAPYGVEIPAFGFPKEISVKISRDPDFKTARKLEAQSFRGNLFSVIGRGATAQYVHITLEGFREYKGMPVLGLGEISVCRDDRAMSINCKVVAEGIPEEYLDQLPRLVDGFSRQRRILPQGEWIKGLAQRRPLDRRLAVVERDLELAQAAWQHIKQRSGMWAIVIAFAGLAGGVVLQQRMRKQGIKKLKWRITRDLHDEVGSNLGSISLAAEQLKHAVANAEAEENLRDLSLLAREASASLREVVWVIDQSTIRLPLLIQKLAERAERVLDEMELFLEISKDCPDCVVSFAFKRHLIMFF